MAVLSGVQGRREIFCALAIHPRLPICLVGVGEIRERRLFGGLPTESNRPLRCGVAAVDLARGEPVGRLEFPTEGANHELTDVPAPGLALRKKRDEVAPRAP
jgi:hypothetical protein